jgi:hypothetical protein
MADADLADLARLIGELGQVLGRLRTRELTAADPAVRCIDCKRRTEKPIAVYDPQGRLVGYRGPQCYQRRGATGVQLPLEQEGADRG